MNSDALGLVEVEQANTEVREEKKKASKPIHFLKIYKLQTIKKVRTYKTLYKDEN